MTRLARGGEGGGRIEFRGRRDRLPISYYRKCHRQKRKEIRTQERDMEQRKRKAQQLCELQRGDGGRKKIPTTKVLPQSRFFLP